MTPEELARYSRQIILPEVGREGQERIRNARILVVGMGGLGSPAALYLAAAGVGTLGLAEFDEVEAHNLQRQILHDNERVGTPKLSSAIIRLRAINPGVQLEPHEKGVQLENATELFSQYDLIVDGTDNFPTRYLNNDAAFLAGKPLVYGSVFQFEGQVSIFDTASGGPCYRCLFPEMPEPGTVPNCEEAGVFGALCGVIGSFQAMEALKYVAGIGESMKGRLMVIDALSMQVRSLKLKRDPSCPLCGDAPKITRLKADNYDWSCAVPTPEEISTESMNELPFEISVDSARELLSAKENAPLLLDVREDYELDIARIEGCVHIPMGEIPNRVGELPKDRKIIVQCHHGGRSLRVANFLKQRGYDDVHNLKGGIDDWAVKIDSSLQRY